MSLCTLLLRRGGRLPLPNPLMELLAIRLGRQQTPAKSLVIPLAGEGANVMPKPIDDRFGSMAEEEWQE